jgi:hypothetical protein
MLIRLTLVVHPWRREGPARRILDQLPAGAGVVVVAHPRKHPDVEAARRGGLDGPYDIRAALLHAEDRGQVEAGLHVAATLRRALPENDLGCLVPIGFLYLFLTYLLVGLGRRFGLALDQLEAPFGTIARANHMTMLGTASSLGIALSYFGCTLGSINAGSRTLYSMAERGKFFGRAHPRNGTPHLSIALLGVAGIAVPVVMLFARVELVSVIEYLSQLSALGFIGSYFMVCLGAPLFLRARASLGPGAMAASAAALVLLAVVMVQSVLAVPTAPACYLPYVFLATVGAGYAISAAFTRRRSAAAV